jgi:hypothetical protein
MARAAGVPQFKSSEGPLCVALTHARLPWNPACEPPRKPGACGIEGNIGITSGWRSHTELH